MPATSLDRFVLSSVVAALLNFAGTMAAAPLPDGFAELQLALGLNSPTCAAVAPDGRVFICQQGGAVRVLKHGGLLATNFVQVPCVTFDEQGLTGIAFDPGFTTNRWVYFTSTRNLTPRRNVIARHTASIANPDVAEPGSEVLLFHLDPQNIAYHLGGALEFGADDRLYATTGECGSGDGPLRLDTLHGKILRLNRDGSIPTDNPFFATASGTNRAIYARGFRNPFTFAVQPGTGRLFANDVGGSASEEVNEIVAGGSYGWPNSEGATTPPNVSPIYDYGRGDGWTRGASVTGGTFYNPPTAQFPLPYRGQYFFADFVNGWINLLNPATGHTVTNFRAPQAGLGPVDVDVAPDGSLYVLCRGQVTSDGGTGPGWDTGFLLKIVFTGNAAPSIAASPASRTVPVGANTTFSVTANGVPPLAYQWRFNASPSPSPSVLPGANAASLTLSNVQRTHAGLYDCVVTNMFGAVTSAVAVLTVTTNTPPMPAFNLPFGEYAAGQQLFFEATAYDAEDGVLRSPAFAWRIDLHHDTHTHPAMPLVTGVTNGVYTIPTNIETSPNIWYRVWLTVTDSGDLSTTIFRDVFLVKSVFALRTDPPGLPLLLDAQPTATPLAVTGVVGVTRSLGVVSPVTLGSDTYEFVEWSDGGASTHDITTPFRSHSYIVTVGVGRRLPGNPYAGTNGGAWRMELLAGETVLTSENGPPLQFPGQFSEQSLFLFTPTIAPALWSQPLRLRLSAGNSPANAHVDFDDVRLQINGLMVSGGELSFEFPALGDGLLTAGPGIVGGWEMALNGGAQCGIFNPPANTYSGTGGDSGPARGQGANVGYLVTAANGASPTLTRTLVPALGSNTYTARFRRLGATTPAVVVNWGGDYVTFDDTVRGYDTPIESGLDLDGDGVHHDARWHCPFSDSLPLTPASAMSGPSWKFFGGLKLHAYNASGFSYHWGEIWSGSPQAPADKLYFGGPLGTHGWDLRYWQQADFNNGGSNAVVTFGSSSRLELLDYEGGDGVPSNNSGRVRFVVRDGPQFYISENFGGPSNVVGADFILDQLPTRRWAQYSPDAPHQLAFDAEHALFAPHTFTNIKAVGYLHSNDQVPAPATNAKAGFTCARVRVTAELGSPLPPALVSIRSTEGRVVLAWPANAGIFVLEAATHLAPTATATSWSRVTNAATLEGPFKTVTLMNIPPTGQRYFRLTTE